MTNQSRRKLKTDLFVSTAEHEGDEILREVLLAQSLAWRNEHRHQPSVHSHVSLTEQDILAFAPLERLNPNQKRLQQIASRLGSLTEMVLQYFPDTLETQGDSLSSREAMLLDKIQDLVNAVQLQYDAHLGCLQRLNELLDQLSATHELLHQTLEQSVKKIPPKCHNLTAARCDYMSATIEASLVKISLLRARAQRALYGANSSTEGNDNTVASAVGVAYRKLKANEMRMRDEERVLDQKLGEYEELLTVVDGDQGGFKQVVDDWTRVRRETEECREDLRRLGWTGD